MCSIYDLNIADVAKICKYEKFHVREAKIPKLAQIYNVIHTLHFY